MKVILIVCLTLLFSSSVLATTCTNKADDKIYKELVNSSDVIFLGKIIAVGSSDFVSTPVTFQIVKGWKGIDSEVITVEYLFDRNVSNSLLLPKIGAAEIIYAHRSLSGKVSTSYCEKVENSEERLKKELGEGTTYGQPQTAPTFPKEQTENAEGFWARLWKTITSFFS